MKQSGGKELDTMILREAKRLYDLGLAIHWLKPQSKAPLHSGWTTGPRTPWNVLKAEYRPRFNLGVRLGTPSYLKKGYLAAIDIDVKSEDKRHQWEALKAVKELFPALKSEGAEVISGRGNGSAHLYVLTKEPVAPVKLRSSTEQVKTFMPSVSAGPAQKKLLSSEEIGKGYRMRPAWEVALLGEGQQIVLPPSIHPDSGKNYKWKRPLTELADLSEVSIFDQIPRREKNTREAVQDFKPVEVDIGVLPLKTIDLLVEGDTEDRSAALFQATIAMVRAGFTDREILSVLTDQDLSLGHVAYDHAKTSSRSKAADWAYNYTLRKARRETDAKFQFDEAVVVSDLSDEETKIQETELVGRDRDEDWKTLIERGGKDGDGKPKPSLKNIHLVLTRAVAPDVFKRDVFAFRDFHSIDAPWGAKAGKVITDDDIVQIRFWLSQNYGIEANKDNINDAVRKISVDNEFHPVREAWNNLPPWDGVVRLDTWLKDHFGAQGPDEYLAQVFRKWLVASVTRVYEPGTKFDWMPVFEGPQGKGKSSFGSILFGEKYFLDNLPDLHDKDAATGLQGILCVEFGEMVSMRANEMNRVKAFVTRTTDKIRPHYGKRWEEFHRQNVFFGTVNDTKYLKDLTGNRRFNPVVIAGLDFEALRRDRDQLFAEAIFYYKNDLETWLYLEDDAARFATEIQTEKMVADDSEIIHEELLNYFFNSEKAASTATSIDRTQFRIKELFDPGGPLDRSFKYGKSIEMKTASVLKMMKAKHWKNRKGIKYWGLTDT